MEKASVISPLLINNKLISNFVEKSDIFNGLFSRQCRPMSNDSTLPSTSSFKTTNQLSTVNIIPEKISKIIQTLDQNEVHGHDEVFVRIIKKCGSSVTKPLQLLFNNCFTRGYNNN